MLFALALTGALASCSDDDNNNHNNNVRTVEVT